VHKANCDVYKEKQILKQEKNAEWGLILLIGNWLDGCGFLLVDLMWV